MSPRIASWETLALVQKGIEGWPFKTNIINSICEMLHKENKWIALNRSTPPPKKKNHCYKDHVYKGHNKIQENSKYKLCGNKDEITTQSVKLVSRR